MGHRNWVRITEYCELKPHIELDDCTILGVLTAQIVPIGLEVQCIRHARYPQGDIFLLPSYRSNALEEYEFPPQSFFRIKGKHKSDRFQLALEEAILRETSPGPLALSKKSMPRIPHKTRKAALQVPAKEYTDKDLRRMVTARTKRLN